MIIHTTRQCTDNESVLYKSGPVYTIVDGQRTLASNGFEARTLEEVVRLVHQAECSFTAMNDKS